MAILPSELNPPPKKPRLFPVKWARLVKKIWIELKDGGPVFLLKYALARFRARYIYHFPTAILIEPTNLCNIHCPICPTPESELHRVKGMLKFEDFKVMADRIAGKIPDLFLFFSGEPFLNKDMYDIVRYASDLGFKITTSTNCTLLTPANIQRILDSGLNHIILSFDGITKESYETYRQGADFETVCRNIQNLARMRREQGKGRPYLELQCLYTKMNQNEIDRLKREVFAWGVDEVNIKSMSLCENIFDEQHTRKYADMFLPIPGNPGLDYLIRYDRNNGETPTPSEAMLKQDCFFGNSSVVLIDGSVVLCCSDINGDYNYGNLLKQDFGEIWNSDRYREERAKGKIRKLDICKNCTVH